MNKFVLGNCHFVPVVSKLFWENEYSSPPRPYYSCGHAFLITLFLPFHLPEPLPAHILESWQYRKQVQQLLAMCTQSPASMVTFSCQVIKAGVPIKPINRDRMNQPNPIPTLHGNHPLPFHSQPGTPFHILYAR